MQSNKSVASRQHWDLDVTSSGKECLLPMGEVCRVTRVLPVGSAGSWILSVMAKSAASRQGLQSNECCQLAGLGLGFDQQWQRVLAVGKVCRVIRVFPVGSTGPQVV